MTNDEDVECGADRDSCPDLPGKDIIGNIMGYSDSQCIETGFTNGQLLKMRFGAEYRVAVSIGG